MKRIIVLGALVATGAAGIAASALIAAQQQQPLEISRVKDNLYVVTGNGGNTAAYVAATGVVLVDTKLANNGAAILEKVRTVTDRPVTHIINTHTHGDHVGSNQFFPASVEVVAHQNTAQNMARMPVFQEAANRHALPDRTFGDRVTVLSGSDAIDLYHFGPAHTSGDAFVVFRGLRVLHAGDVFPGPNMPFMDGSNGGTGRGYPATLEWAAAGIRNVDTVIPGHAPVTTWQAFVDYGEFVRSFVTSVETSARAGRSREQALAEFRPAPKFASFGMQRAPANVELIYNELRPSR